MISFLAIFKKKNGSLVQGPRGPRPERDWLILIAAALVLIGASVVWNVGLFSRIANGGWSVEDAGSNVLKTYPAGAIDELFENRAQMEAAYRSSFPFVDPSR